MIKTAIFVEGQTELIFVREYLLKMFDYQNIWIECYTLFTDSKLNSAEYSVKNEDAAFYFQVISVGNDNSVLTRILNRENYLWKSGFHKIFGLRDMYSRNYRELVQNATIDQNINLRFVDSSRKTIETKAQKAENIHFHFAIMEVEAWILALPNCFLHINQDLNSALVLENLGIDLDTTDPETTFFHPATVVEQIYGLANASYSKSKGDINAIMSNVQKEDFIELSESGKCNSFNAFHNTLIPN